MNPIGQTLTRGALASVVKTTLTDVVLFQYNPESIKRDLTPRMSGYEAGKAPSDASTDLTYTDAASQSITFTAYFDAADALQVGDPTAVANGIAPQLALLEKMVNPRIAAIDKAEEMNEDGKMVIVTMNVPGTILVWGPNRVLPVRIKSINFTEEAFDASLNPIRANAVISLDVQTYANRKKADFNYGRFYAYHRKLEGLASKANASGSDTTDLLALLNR